MTTPFPFVANTVLNASQLNAITTLPVNARTANYTLVVGDVGYRVQMTNASATTITVNTSIFSAGDTIWIQNMGAGTCTITSGTCTVSTASSLALAQYGGGTLVFQSASAATFFSGGASYGIATGLTGALASPPTGYSGLYATSDGTLTVTKAGLFEVLMFGGGAAGGGYGSTSSGGGGAGGKMQSTLYLEATTYAVTIGAGAAKDQLVNPWSGLATKLGTVLTAVGGGMGAGDQTANIAQLAAYGGCGGGGWGNKGGSSFPAGAPGWQGFAGGNGATSTNAGGGGGGVAAVGAVGSGTTGGAGGAGFDVSAFIGGSALFKGGGGGGGGTSAGGAGGSSVGGAGGTGTGSNAAANTGSGGGGAGSAVSNGAGGSGIFYIRFKV